MIAPTPPMGWNSWNTFGAEVTEDVVRETARAFLDLGFKEAGYQYVVIDDFWEADERDGDLRLQAHPERFPSGIKALADDVHALGLKFGIYSCAGTHTCGQRPASYGYEEIDAQTFADWGVDFLKYDFCYKPLGVEGRDLYRRMGRALRATGRDILFSACEWGTNKVWEWGREAGCHMWRTTGDISDNFHSICDLGFKRQEGLHVYAGPNGWNDPDMLVVGMRGKGNVGEGGCTDGEYRIHFWLWCLLASPLMIGADIRNLDDVSHRLLTNRNLIAVNQDPLGAQGRRIGGWDRSQWDWDLFQVFAKTLSDGSYAVGLFNLHDENCHRMLIAWEALALEPTRRCRVQDLFTGEDLGEFRGYFDARVPQHDCLALKVTPC